MQHINDFLAAHLGGSSFLWDVALGVFVVNIVASSLRFILHLVRIYMFGEA